MEDFPTGSTLARCGTSGVEALRSRWVEQHYPADTVVVSTEDRRDDVYFILSGLVRIMTVATNGREVPFVELGPGWNFGEIAALDAGPRSSTVCTAEPSRLARLTARQFHQVLEEQSGVMRAVMSNLASRVRSLSARVVDLTALKARDRLIEELLMRARPIAPEADVAVIRDKPTQQALANAIGTWRETVGRDLSSLRAKGIISTDRRTLTVHSLERLRAERRPDV